MVPDMAVQVIAATGATPALDDPTEQALTIRRFAVRDAVRYPILEEAHWLPTDDPKGVTLDGFDGRWVLFTLSNALVALPANKRDPELDSFGNLIDFGEPADLLGWTPYDKPLLPGITLLKDAEEWHLAYETYRVTHAPDSPRLPGAPDLPVKKAAAKKTTTKKATAKNG